MGGGRGGGEGGEGKERGKIGAKVLVILYIQKGTSSITVIVAPYSSMNRGNTTREVRLYSTHLFIHPFHPLQCYVYVHPRRYSVLVYNVYTVLVYNVYTVYTVYTVHRTQYVQEGSLLH